MPRLVIRRQGELPRVLELTGERPISIGRAKSSNLVLDDESVSRLHAVLRPTIDGQWQIIDRNSANGVKINGAAIKEINLKPNDEVTVGVYSLKFEQPDASGFTPYETLNLPKSVVREMERSPYSGSFLAVEPIVGLDLPDAKAQPDVTERVRALERENRLLTLLYRAARALGDLNEIEKVTDRVLGLVLEIEGVERGYVMLVDEGAEKADKKDNYVFHPAVIRYRNDSPESTNGGPQLVMSQSIIAQVMQTGVPLLIADAKADTRFSARQSIVQSGMQSAMCAPLGGQKRRFGLLYVDNLSRRGMFTVEDLNVFAVIASQAGWAIERIRARNAAPEKVPALS